jgi:hypothetical protein
MGGAPAPVVSGPSQQELDQRQQQFNVTTQLQRESQAQQMSLQQRQLELQQAAQTRQLEAQQREAQMADNASRRDTLLKRSTDLAAQNDASLFGSMQQEQSALTANAANTATEKQKKTSATSSSDRSNLISSLTRARSIYG